MEVQCRFYTNKEKNRFFTEAYTCSVKNVSKASLEKEVKSFNGSHDEWFKNNKDVKWLCFANIPIGVVPRNLHKVFPNLKYLSMMDCGVEKISREDLKELEAIEYIDLSKNKLTSLPNDLFDDMKKLRWIYFNDNQLEHLSSILLKPIERTLELASFKDNKRINEWFDKNHKENNDLAEFMRSIDSNCLPAGSQAERIFAEFAKFRSSGELTDFTIKVRGKEFKLHKMVFAAQSSVFKRTFIDNVKDVTKSLEKFRSFSEGTFEQFFDFFYTWKLGFESNATEMFELASEFDVQELKIICTARILGNLNGSNAVEVFNLAHRHESEELKRKSFEVIKKKFPELDATFENKLDEVNNLVALKTEMEVILKKT